MSRVQPLTQSGTDVPVRPVNPNRHSLPTSPTTPTQGRPSYKSNTLTPRGSALKAAFSAQSSSSKIDEYDLQYSGTMRQHHSGSGNGKAYVDVPDSYWSTRTLLPIATSWDIAMWAVCCIGSANLFSWNVGLVSGWGSVFIATVLMGMAFLCLSMCLAELSSALPASGGSYFYARCTLGLHVGALVGYGESLEYLLTTAVNIIQCGNLFIYAFNTDPQYSSLWDVSLYCVLTGIQIYGGHGYWRTIRWLAYVQMVVMSICILGSLAYVSQFAFNATHVNGDMDVDGNSLTPAQMASNTTWFIGGMAAFAANLPNNVWWYVGIEAMGLAAEETVDCKRSLPKGTVQGMVIIVVMQVLTCVLAVSSPAINQAYTLLTAPFPLIFTFANLFSVTVNTQYLVLLFVPSMFSAALGFAFCYSRNFFAMSRTGLTPQAMSLVTKSRHTPYVGLLFGGLFGILVTVIVRNAVDYDMWVTVVYNSMLLMALLNYLTQLLCFTLLRVRYPMLTRLYRSPCGLPGAVVSLLIFGMALLCLLIYGLYMYETVVFCSIFVGTGLMYYALYGRHHLITSPTESAALFMLYSLKFIREKQQRVLHPGRYVHDTDPSNNRHVTRTSSNAPLSPQRLTPPHGHQYTITLNPVLPRRLSAIQDETPNITDQARAIVDPVQSVRMHTADWQSELTAEPLHPTHTDSSSDKLAVSRQHTSSIAG